MRLSRAQAAKLVSAALSTLYERRPFKWDLAKFEDEDSKLWKEMVRTMQDDVIAEAKPMRACRSKQEKGSKKSHKIRTCGECGQATSKAQGARKMEFETMSNDVSPVEKAWFCPECQ